MQKCLAGVQNEITKCWWACQFWRPEKTSEDHRPWRHHFYVAVDITTIDGVILQLILF